MDEEIAYLMSQNIERQSVDLEKMLKEDADGAMRFVYNQYHLATDKMVRLSQPSRRT